MAAEKKRLTGRDFQCLLQVFDSFFVHIHQVNGGGLFSLVGTKFVCNGAGGVTWIYASQTSANAWNGDDFVFVARSGQQGGTRGATNVFYCRLLTWLVNRGDVDDLLGPQLPSIRYHGSPYGNGSQRHGFFLDAGPALARD